MQNTLETLESRTLMAAGDIDSSFKPVAMNVALPRTDLSNATAVDLAVDRSGRSYVFGNVKLGSGKRERSVMFVARFGVDGKQDLNFGSYGIAVVDLAALQDAKSIAVDGAGRINLAFDVSQPFPDVPGDMVRLAQLNSNGTLNRRFGQSGTTWPRFGPESSTGDLAVDAQNNIVLVANAAGSVGVAKLTPSGRVHTSLGFGSRGVRILAGTKGAVASSMALTSSRIYIGATVPSASVSDFGVYALATNGTYDTRFSGDGVATADIAGGRDVLNQLVVDSAGRLMLVGKRASRPEYTNDPTDALTSVVRLSASGKFDKTFSRRVLLPDTRFDGPGARIADFDGEYFISSASVEQRLSYSGGNLGNSHLDLDGYGSYCAGLVSAGGKLFSVVDDGTYVHGEPGLQGLVVTRRTEPTVGVSDLVWISDITHATVNTDGKLLLLDRSSTLEPAILRYDKDGTRLTTARRGWTSYDPDWTYPNPQSLRGATSFALPDGSVSFALDGADAVDGDSVAYTGWSVERDGSEAPLWSSRDEMLARYFRRHPGGYMSFLASDSVGTSYNFDSVALNDLLGDARQSIGFDWWRDTDNLLPGQPRTVAPIAGSTDVLVTGEVLDEHGDPTGPDFVVRVARGTPNAISYTYPITDFDFAPLLVQSSGKILYTRPGEWSTPTVPGLYRLNTDGTPDTTFGVNGVVGLADGFDHFDVDSKGRIIAWRVLKGGAADGDVQIARFTPEGKIDTTFGGGDGITAVDTHVNSTARTELIIDAQDRLIVTGAKLFASSVSWSATRILG